ncbi:hypothetical protein DSL72_003981 [Monilinia vaccinii-corymbosi]|uniref:Uncharacterized protein n=1 Tax=Monilinia vaccinii-corymbosi TaxID=61207 RepID=A0A8A3P9I3_9HELO|nr:hypothetical protein DSL72_003981 [Monilinia vaccinii-corymbosi]
MQKFCEPSSDPSSAKDALEPHITESVNVAYNIALKDTLEVWRTEAAGNIFEIRRTMMDQYHDLKELGSQALSWKSSKARAASDEVKPALKCGSSYDLVQRDLIVADKDLAT